jgi:hypothetical protein
MQRLVLLRMLFVNLILVGKVLLFTTFGWFRFASWSDVVLGFRALFFRQEAIDFTLVTNSVLNAM